MDIISILLNSQMTFYFKKMTPRTTVKGNILTLNFEDEEDVVIFQREDQFKGGSMLFAHFFIRTEKYEMVQVNATRFATEKGIFFAVDKAGFEEICETALAFECLWCMNMNT